MCSEFRVMGIRNMAVVPDQRNQQDPNKSYKESHSRMDERAEIEAFMQSVPAQGVAVTVFPGNNLEAAEKKLRKKINQEGILLKYREAKVKLPTRFKYPPIFCGSLQAVD